MPTLDFPVDFKKKDGTPYAVVFPSAAPLTSMEGDYGLPLATLEGALSSIHDRCFSRDSREAAFASDLPAVHNAEGNQNANRSKTNLENSLAEAFALFKKEADSGGTFTAVSRETSKVEAALLGLKGLLKEHSKSAASKLLEADAELPTRFRVIIIEEGLGNLGSCFYYTKDALKSGVGIFEGKKAYANHPSESEQQDRPERDVRDVFGHYEDVQYSEKDGRGQLLADLQCLPDTTTLWARAKLNQSIEYSKKYPDKVLVGLSINADGDSQPIAITDLRSKFPIPADSEVKLKKAEDMGIAQVNLVTEFTDATSCDLVTDPGAGGRALSALD
jgi:hypothetical protein